MMMMMMMMIYHRMRHPKEKIFFLFFGFDILISYFVSHASDIISQRALVI
jgi:hypothetical protein